VEKAAKDVAPPTRKPLTTGENSAISGCFSVRQGNLQGLHTLEGDDLI
jgi:hypothetical protein